MQRTQATVTTRKSLEHQLWGPYFKQLREQYGFTRPKFLQQYLKTLDTTGADESHYDISESWLARIERGETVNITRDTMELLCTTVTCSANERLILLALADRNFLVDVKLDLQRIEDLKPTFWLVKRLFDVFAKLMADPTNHTMLDTMLTASPDVELADVDVLNIVIALLEAQDERN
jgi:transcriptional regulator with XRE-family HTH domain